MLRLLLPRAAPSNNLVWRGDRGGHVPERGGLLSGRLWLEKFLTVLTPCRMHPPNSWSGISSGQTCIRVSQFSQLSWPLPVSFQGHFLFNLPLAPLMTQYTPCPQPTTAWLRIAHGGTDCLAFSMRLCPRSVSEEQQPPQARRCRQSPRSGVSVSGSWVNIWTRRSQ